MIIIILHLKELLLFKWNNKIKYSNWILFKNVIFFVFGNFKNVILKINYNKLII